MHDKNPIKVLLVEDDKNLGFVIKDNLELNGYRVTLCDDGEKGMSVFLSEKFDICILDIMLPKLDGITMGKSIRNCNYLVPILFLTAKSLKEDKLAGFQAGGDDYITKPFSVEELIMRMQVFLKRTMVLSTPKNEEEYHLGSFTFYYKNILLKSADQEIFLTQKEADLLKLFCINVNQTMKREDILMKIWGDDDYFLGRSLDVFISRLRKYLRDETKVHIINHHGIGFTLQCHHHNTQHEIS
ncbi:MAG: response regulator transcription factor [Bacteroidota bacterium]|nr:response regulator transcription factor [Bacteroidota bacterium]